MNVIIFVLVLLSERHLFWWNFQLTQSHAYIICAVDASKVIDIKTYDISFIVEYLVGQV